MDLRTETKQLVQKEKEYTALIIKNLATIEKKKLFSDYGYPTLFKYITRELQYSESEAYIRVGAVKLALRDKSTMAHMKKGDLSLTNAFQVHVSLCQYEKEKKTRATPKLVGRMLDLAKKTPTRETKNNLRIALELKTPQRETLVLDEQILGKIKRAKKLYGDISSTYELLDILLEEKLKTPHRPLRSRNTAVKVSRYIPVGVKHAVHKGQCVSCGTRRNLEYDHIREYATGGTNTRENIQVLCRNCNKRKEICRRTSSSLGPWP